MRSLVRRTILAAVALGATAVWSGCQAKQATEYVAGISTQVIVPRDLKVVRIDVTVGGILQTCRVYKVQAGGVVQLPRSLGAFPVRDESIKSSGPMQYTVVGYTQDIDPEGDVSACTQPKVGEQGARILRRSRQPYVPEEILFLPMPLKYACFDKNCGDDETCKGGKCVSAVLTEEQAKVAFPRFSPDLVDGTGGTCFSTSVCMAAAAPVVLVDQANCIYAVPNTPSAPAPILGPNPFSGPSSGDGVNVEVTYDGGLVREVLDLDPDEGFSIPDPNFPQRFKLAPGLCEMVKGVEIVNGNPIATTHRITAIRTSGTCQSKRLPQPICAGDQFKAMGLDTSGQIPNPPPADICSSAELKPPPSALIVVVDNTLTHKPFFTKLNATLNINDQDTLVEPAIKAALSDPAFEKTEIGLAYMGGINAACAVSDLEIPPGLAASTRDPILAKLKAEEPTLISAVPSVENGIARAYGELDKPKYANFFKRAVLVIGNGGYDHLDGCSPATTGPNPRAAAKKAAGIDTYVMQLTKDAALAPDSLALGAEQLAQSGGTNNAAYRVDAAKDKFQSIVNTLGTCVYDVPVASTKDTDIVSFSDPLSPTPADLKTDVKFNAACNAENVPGEGWGYAANSPNANQRRIHLCSAPCEKFRGILKKTSLFTAGYGQPPIPIPIFSYRKDCVVNP